jgi:putative Mg2+ transporter-C (MgtC) family protein
VIILLILAGLKPLAARYKRTRSDLHLSMTAQRGTISVGLLQDALGVRTAQIRQLIIDRETEGQEEASLLMTRPSLKDAQDIIDKLRALPGIQAVQLVDA